MKSRIAVTDIGVAAPIGIAEFWSRLQKGGSGIGPITAFDAGRDGFVMAEGAAAVLLLEPLDAARTPGTRIYAEVCGYGQTTDTHHMTAPGPVGRQAARAMRMAPHKAGIQLEDVGYVNTHATSTTLVDAAETEAIKQAFRAHNQRLAISATKSMTGALVRGCKRSRSSDLRHAPSAAAHPARPTCRRPSATPLGAALLKGT